ncbi:Putative thiosulfate sulfurtransferase SseB [uncultured Comamonas sp.]|nr:Putative thiosulfate sulfurtransferase SseB [uncultured Comamonas sp.]
MTSALSFPLLISVAQLQSLQAGGQPLMVFDCSFDLAQPGAGLLQYREAHVPGAVYAHLDESLSAAAGDAAASGGRHPLPSREAFAAWLRSVGFRSDMQAVVYDRQGVNYCGRLWWMLKWAGHEAVAVLDGGLQAWQAAGGAVESGAGPAYAPGDFALQAPLRRLVGVDAVQAQLGSAVQTIVDARAPARFRGEVEPLDPVAGHIPGALNRPFTDNIALDGRFKPAALLRAEFDALLAGRDPASVVHQCGSGVSAVPNLVAMEVAGFAPTALFAGSWSQWCSDPGRPCAQGA